MPLTQAKEMSKTIETILANDRGILALDESIGTIGRRFAGIGVDNTFDNRRKWRDIILSTPQTDGYPLAIGGVILFTEQLQQRTSDGTTFPDLIHELGMVCGVKTDLGQASISGTDETMMEGLDELHMKCRQYYSRGARFAKFRAIYHLNTDACRPTDRAVHLNNFILARCASICQQCGLVPVVEPEVLSNGTHRIDVCATASVKVWTLLFDELQTQEVDLSRMLLKTNMVTPGLESTQSVTPSEIADQTVACLRASVPAEVPGVVFLSGGMKEVPSTANLNAIARRAKECPWKLSFSFGRALQATALRTWAGQDANIEAAQHAFSERCRANHQAVQGVYTGEHALKAESAGHVFGAMIGEPSQPEQLPATSA